MSKLINVSDEIYETLKKLKGSESFSIAIKKVLEKRSNKEHLLSFFGKGGIDEKKVEEAVSYVRKWSKKYA
ncbi:MAG TPA: antitoxin VapB family protein [Candidatus Nanoarchaeia archaeon]|nr:antitoxin VapB family protein [Candidatus Nanoarchaeia archaeon]